MNEKVLENCPQCNSPLSPVEETPTGKKLQRCSQGSWNPETRQVEGCAYVKWIVPEPQELDEKCPECGSNLVLQVTRFGKKMKKCSQGGWDRETKKPTGCPYVEWLGTNTEELDEECPECGEKLVLFTTARGKKLKKCSTQGWDRETRQVTGCPYSQWLTAQEAAAYTAKTGEENLPPAPSGEKTPF